MQASVLAHQLSRQRLATRLLTTQITWCGIQPGTFSCQLVIQSNGANLSSSKLRPPACLQPVAACCSPFWFLTAGFLLTLCIWPLLPEVRTGWALLPALTVVPCLLPDLACWASTAGSRWADSRRASSIMAATLTAAVRAICTEYNSKIGMQLLVGVTRRLLFGLLVKSAIGFGWLVAAGAECKRQPLVCQCVSDGQARSAGS